jgi:hypothetical protein
VKYSFYDDVNVLGDTSNIGTIKENAETLTDAGKEVGLEVNAENTKYISLSCNKNKVQNHDIKIANRFFENVAHFKHLGTTISNQNFIQEKIKRRLDSSNACYQSIQKLWSFRLLSKSINLGCTKL